MFKFARRGRAASWSAGLMVLLAGAARADVPKLALEQPAPELTVTTLDGKAAGIANLRAANKDKILVLQFGSLTDPIFRNHAAAVEKLANKESDKALFVIVYQKEAHASDGADPLDLNTSDAFNLAEPQNAAERAKLAAQMVERLKIKNQTVVVDAWSNASSIRYGGYANMTFVVDAYGNLQAGYPFMDTTKVQAAIELMAAGKPLTPELKGPTQKSGPAPFDFATAAMDMTGGRGPGTVAAVLEHIELTEEERLALFPALADFLADVQTFRQTRQAVPNLPAARGPARGGQANTPARGPVAPPAAGGTTPEVKTPEDLQQAQAALRASASRVKSVIHQTLSAKDATALLDALDAMVPAQRVFAN